MRAVAVRRTAVAVSAAAAIALAGCSLLPGAPPGDHGSPGAKPHWGEWIDLPFASSIVTAKDGLVVLKNDETQRLAVYDASGGKKWDLPKVKMVGTYEPVVVADADRIYAQLPNGSVTALDWESGNRAWTFDAASIDRCAPADHFTLVSASRTHPLLSGDNPLVLSYGSEDANGEELSAPPSACTDRSNSSLPDITTLVGIDRASGKRAWAAKDGSINVIDTAVATADGTGVARIVSHRGYPGLSVTEAATGHTSDAPLVSGGQDSLTARGYTPGERVHLRALGARDYVLDYSADGAEQTTLMVHVDEWNPANAGKSGKTGAVTMTSTGAQPPCPATTAVSAQGYIYCIALPQGRGRNVYRGALLAAADAALPVTLPDPWEHPAPVPEEGDYADAGDGAATSFGDPLIPREGKSPLVALLGKEAAVEAVDAATGETAWQLKKADLTAALGRAGGGASASAAGADGDADGADDPAPAMRYVPGVDELQIATLGTVIGLSAQTGEVAWTEQATGSATAGASGAPQRASIGMVTGAGGFLDLKIDAAEKSTSRLRAVQHG